MNEVTHRVQRATPEMELEKLKNDFDRLRRAFDLVSGGRPPDEILNGSAPVASPPICRFFAYSHLPPHLQAVSEPFCALVDVVLRTTQPGPEQTVCLRKLLEAKDAAVRAAL